MKYHSMVLGNYSAWDEGSGTASAKSKTRSEVKLASQEIASLAYCYWIERGRPLGSPELDWFRAEAEMKARIATPAATPRAEAKARENKRTLAAGA